MRTLKVIYLFVAVFLTNSMLSAQEAPVTYEVEAPEKASKKKGFQIDVNFQTKGDWYIYAPTGLNEKAGMIETKVNFELPEGVSTDGDLILPAPQPYGMYQVYKGKDIQISQKFKAAKKGTYEITCTVTYQTCNKSICLPPDTKSYKRTIKIK